jgi:uncharacterized protein YigA (DUF484 family)
MKKIIFILFFLQIFFLSVANAKAEVLNINKSCEIVTQDAFKNAEPYLGQIKSIKNNPYQYFLFLKTDAKNVKNECIVLVNFELKLTEYIDQKKKQDSKENRVCSENTSLLLKPENLKAYFYQYVHQKIDACLLN